MRKYRKPILFSMLSVLLAALLWAGMVFTDYTLSTKAKRPVFAQSVSASDALIYRGLGYRIVLTTGYAVSPTDAELKGYFYWGWR